MKLNLFANLIQYGDNVCLIEHSQEVTYAQLQSQANEIAEELSLKGTARKLVFIEVDNSILSIATYVACIQNHCPTLLLNPENASQNEALNDKYRPNLFINTCGKISIQHINAIPYSLHQELALLLSTSGSTGTPKLVKLSHNNIASNTQSIISYLSISQSDRAITSLKFNYSYGLSIINTHLCAGASIVLTQENSLSTAFWAQVRQYQVTSFSGVPHHFETFKAENFSFKPYPSLRYLTQAGGKLHPDLVKEFVNNGREFDIDFWVMYGQTEAAPRISYLPPDLAWRYPQAIGKAVPGGELFLQSNNGEVITQNNVEGELIYKGPNVMIGYASHVNDLAEKTELPHLKTGDIALKIDVNIYQITGRVSRFVKPMGIRVNLDDVSSWLKTQGHSTAIVSNDKEYILIAFLASEQSSSNQIVQLVAEYLKLPKNYIIAKEFDYFPQLANEKVDYNQVKKDINQVKWQDVIRWFLANFFKAIKENLGLKNKQYNSILELYLYHFPEEKIADSTTFVLLGGDSLCYVQLSLEIEDYLGGVLPTNWHQLPIKALEEMKYENRF